MVKNAQISMSCDRKRMLPVHKNTHANNSCVINYLEVWSLPVEQGGVAFQIRPSVWSLNNAAYRFTRCLINKRLPLLVVACE
jgi:hypothetical protein